MSYKEKIKELQENYREALLNFVSKLQERATVANPQHPNTFEVKNGRKYDKIICCSHGNISVYAFIDKETGGILKPAGWKQPEPKKYERGNIFNENPLEGTNQYGVDYINYDNSQFKMKGFDK